jgi:predicted dehydrogenase
MSAKKLGIGVVGCGGFALFALEQFIKVPGVRLAMLADTVPKAVAAAAKRFPAPTAASAEEVVANPDVDLVYIATPPFLHYSQSMLALKAGKHVICEKPLAMTVAEADEMLATAKEGGLLIIANLMQRYNPTYALIKQLVDENVLGTPLHGIFENYATDETLPPEHWFWDPALNGRIFIEHGVHFFDMFNGWFGPGKVEAAQVSMRPGFAQEDQVQCTIRYGDTYLANHYHGFTQARRMDRQEIRLLFTQGEVSLYEWVPTRVRVQAIVDAKTTAKLTALFPGARVDILESYEGDEQACRGHGTDMEVTQKIELLYGEDIDKSALYSQMLLSMLTDQLAWINDPSHERVITEQNGRASLVMAEDADTLSH